MEWTEHVPTTDRHYKRQPGNPQVLPAAQNQEGSTVVQKERKKTLRQTFLGNNIMGGEYQGKFLSEICNTGVKKEKKKTYK